MFKKKPQIKNLSPLRSSERRKLADQIRKDYSIADPKVELQTSDSDTPDTHHQQNLTTLRNALLPESTSSAKFTTTHGPNAALVSGVIYVGAHPGEDERILWFQLGKDERLIPTVYTLWHNPDLITLLYTGDIVIQKLKGGADLFAPGLVRPHKGFDSRATKTSVVAAASVRSDTVPRWVGICDLDLSSVQDAVAGTAARGLHWEGDELWSWSTLGKGGKPAPERVEGWPSIAESLANDVQDMDIEEDDDNEETAEGGVALQNSVNGGTDSGGGDAPNEGGNVEDDEHIPTTKEVDDAFVEAFLYAVWEAKKNNAGSEPYGLPLPIQPSFLIANMVQPHLRHQSPHYNIKKTSWKNAKKFIKHLDKAKLLKSKDRNGGETVILDIDFKDEQVKNFQPYKLTQSKTVSGGKSVGGDSEQSGDASVNQQLTLQVLYRASSKLVPDLLPSKTAFYTSQQITSALKQYIESNPGLVNENKKRFVKLDPFIANNILGSNSSSDDNKALSAGEIDRGTLNRRILEDDHLCQSYHILLRNDQTYRADDHTAKPRAGPPPRITLTKELRTGKKVVTSVAGLEVFFINPQVLRPELQKKCAGSASVGQLVGGKPGMLEIQIQGDQKDAIEKELAKRGVKSEWIDLVDKTKKKGKE